MMIKKIITLLGIFALMGFVACQRQGTTNGSFKSVQGIRAMAPEVTLPSQFNWVVNFKTKKVHAELLIYQEDKVTMVDKFTFDTSTDQISKSMKGNEVIYTATLTSNENINERAHMVITETHEYIDKGVSLETWLRTTAHVSLVIDPTFVLKPDLSVSIEGPLIISHSSHSENLLEILKVIGEHRGESKELEHTELKIHYPEGGRESTPAGHLDPRRQPQK